MATQDYTNKYIEVKLTAQGRYVWSIRLPNENAVETVKKLQEIDTYLRNAFPKNTAEIKSSTRFTETDFD